MSATCTMIAIATCTMIAIAQALDSHIMHCSTVSSCQSSSTSRL